MLKQIQTRSTLKWIYLRMNETEFWKVTFSETDIQLDIIGFEECSCLNT